MKKGETGAIFFGVRLEREWPLATSYDALVKHKCINCKPIYPVGVMFSVNNGY